MELKKDTLISVIIPFYNEENYFDECIKSALDQTYSNIEIIIVNDGSDYSFEKKLKDLELEHPDILRVFNKKNEGAGYARNFGIQKAKGDYIAFLDSDDAWLPYKLEHQMNIIKKKNINFIHGSYLILNEESKFIGKFISKDLNYEKLLKSCDIGLSTVMVKSDLIKRNLFKNITTKEDFVCWLSIIKETNLLHGNDKVVMIYRNKSNSLSSGVFKKFINAYKVYYKYENKKLFLSLYFTIYLSYSWFKKSYMIIFKNPSKVEFKYVRDIKKVKFDKSFIFSALNMASLSNIKLLYMMHDKIIFWIDGYCAKLMVPDTKKIPGRLIIKDLNIPENIDNIYLCGKRSNAQIEYMENKFKRKIIFHEVPFFNQLKQIKNFKLNIKENSIVILNISTPKQEVLANNILKNNLDKNIYIFCLGGGMSMVSGEEKIVPENIEKLNLEWLWRLRTNTMFRLKRLIISGLSFIFHLLTKFYSKTSFKIIN